MKADKFSHKGKLEVEDGNSIIANKLDIDNAHIMQPFLTVEKISKDNFKLLILDKIIKSSIIIYTN